MAEADAAMMLICSWAQAQMDHLSVVRMAECIAATVLRLLPTAPVGLWRCARGVRLLLHLPSLPPWCPCGALSIVPEHMHMHHILDVCLLLRHCCWQPYNMVAHAH